MVCSRSASSRVAESMDEHGEPRFDLSAAKATAWKVAREWGLELGQPFALSNVSYVAPAGDADLKVGWERDHESLHEGDALEADHLDLHRLTPCLEERGGPLDRP